jgi:hypothetical protein
MVPTVEVQIIAIARVGLNRSIEADKVVVLVFHPNSAIEAPFSGVTWTCWFDVDKQAAHVTQKFPAHKRKVIIRALKVFIDNCHLYKAAWQQLHVVDTRQFGKRMKQTTVRLAGKHAVPKAMRHVDLPGKILITSRSIRLVLLLQVLNTGFDHRMQVLKLGHQKMLAIDES